MTPDPAHKSFELNTCKDPTPTIKMSAVPSRSISLMTGNTEDDAETIGMLQLNEKMAQVETRLQTMNSDAPSF